MIFPASNVVRVTDLLAAPYLIKVCAVTSVGDAQMVVHAGASALGVILADSPRRVPLESAVEIFRSVQDRIARVGVFRHSTYDEIARAVDALDLEVVQIYGAIPAGVTALVRERGLNLFEALSTDELGSASGLGDAYLIDGPRPGSGEAQDWLEVAQRHWDRPLIVAGGLTGETIYDVLASVNPWGCDVASGSESSPGVKDRERVESFVRNARQYFEDREENRG